MTYQEIKAFINTYIVQNGVNAITGSQLNTALNALADYYGFDAVTVETLPAGSEATVNVQGRTLELGIPKGADGRDGSDATNPFKGWFDSLADLKASYTALIGDSAYVKDASPATTWSIYIYDSTASSNNYWGDSGIDADTSNVQTFASGEELNETYIDDTHLVNPKSGALPAAADVMQLKVKLEGVTASETKVQLVTSGEEQNVYNGYINGSTGTYNQSNYNKFIVVPLNGAKSVRWLGKENASNSSYIGWAFGTFSGEINATLSTFTALSKGVYANNPSDNQAVEYIKNAPEGATHAVITIWIYKSGGGSAVTMDNFYCYLQSGESVVDLFESLNSEINEIPYNLGKEKYTDIDLSQYSDITTATIIRSENVWGNTYTYNAFKLIPAFPGAIFEIKANGDRYAQITFLKSDTVVIGGTPDYAGDIDEVSSIAPNTAKKFIAPNDAIFMYVLIQQADNSTYWRTPEYVRLIQPAYIQQSKIVDNFDSNDDTTVLSGALGPVLKQLVEAGKPINRISPLGGQKVQGANLYYADGAWTLGTERSCTFVDIQGLGIKKIQVVTGNHTAHFGFVSDFTVPDNGVEGLENTYASIIDRIYTLNSNTSVEKDVPSEAKFIYFNIRNNTQSYIPKEVNILEQDSSIEPLIPSWNNNYNYETYVEENYVDAINPSVSYKIKTYKIDHDAEYAVILYGSGNSSSFPYTINGVKTYDANGNNVRTIESYNWGNGVKVDFNMQPIEFLENEVSVSLAYYCYNNNNNNNNGYDGKGALMRMLKNDKWIPINSLIYCVSKIKSPVMPYNYQTEETVFPQTDEWSAWVFVMPYNYNRVLFTNKKFPICTFFHGSSGYVTPDNMGYYSGENIMSMSHGKTIVGMLREAGYVVFDINGYGISRTSDNKSRHWGNPRAVATVKKAYEVLVDRFNCRRGMAISGISMGGAIAKSYCMTYPGDVVCAAMEAPSELGGTCRFSVTGGHVENTSQTSAAHAWGYENAAAMYADNEHTAFIGYSPCIAPNVIDENGFIKKIVQTDWNEQEDIFDNLDSFSCNFPVEIKIWHGDADTNVPLKYNQWFVNTVRNANGNATLRLCPDCVHDLNNYPWVRQEIVNYIDSKMKI